MSISTPFGGTALHWSQVGRPAQKATTAPPRAKKFKAMGTVLSRAEQSEDAADAEGPSHGPLQSVVHVVLLRSSSDVGRSPSN